MSVTSFFTACVKPDGESGPDVMYRCVMCSRPLSCYRNARRHASTHMDAALKERVNKYVLRKCERNLEANTFVCTVCNKEFKSKKDQALAYERDHCIWHHLLIIDQMQF